MPWKKPKSSNEATLNFISSLLPANCAFAHALFIVVLARDLEAASGTSFDAASCATCGENARKGLDRLIPPTGGRGRAAQELNKEGARLRLLARLADPLIKERLGSLARFAFPFQQHLQYHEHLDCDDCWCVRLRLVAFASWVLSNLLAITVHPFSSASARVSCFCVLHCVAVQFLEVNNCSHETNALRHVTRRRIPMAG